MKTIRCIAIASFVHLVHLAQAQAEPIDAARAAEAAMDKNPSLQAAWLDVQASHSAVLAEEDQYPLLLQLDGGVTHLRNPSLVNPDDVLTSTSDSVVLGSELKKSFSFGTALALRVEGTWTRASSALFPGSEEEVTLGPGYGISARFSVVQPLLRGFGNDAGEAELRGLEVQRTAAVSARERAASELLRDVLVAYWELWYATEALRIEQDAVALATRERDDVQARIDGGAMANVEVYPFSTRVAELEDSVMLAELDRKRRAMELATLLGRPGVNDLVAAEDPPPNAAPRDRKAAVDRAYQSSPSLKEADARIEAAREGERVAGEPDRQRLDVEGWVQTEGLGNRRVPPAFEQLGKFGAVSAHVGLVWELPLTGSRYDHQKQRAAHDVDAAMARKDAVLHAIHTDVTALIDRMEVATRRLELAERTVTIARDQLKAANDRYDEGDGLAIEIGRAEDAVRQAELRRVRARIDAVTSELQLEHLTGELLARKRNLLDRVPPKPAPLGMRKDHGPF